MRQFAHKGFRIDQLSTEARVIYTAFLVLSLAALALSVVYYYDLTDGRPLAGARDYYVGEQIVDRAATESDDTGPILDLPAEVEQEEAAATKLIVPMTRRKLLEVTHFHLFTVPVFLLIIGHIFMLCPMRPRLKMAIILSGLVSTVAHIAAPWLVYAGGASWAFVMPVTGTWMTASMLALAGWPLVAMWRR